MIFIGIDPGQAGGIGMINTSEDWTAAAWDMPVIKGDIFVTSLAEIFPDDGKVFCMLEQAQVMPKQGIKGAFTYGVGYGKIKATLEFLSIPYQEIAPSVWKKEFSLIKKSKAKKSKADAVGVARHLFPWVEFLTERGRLLDGRAEALLLAEYAKRKYNEHKSNRDKKLSKS